MVEGGELKGVWAHTHAYKITSEKCPKPLPFHPPPPLTSLQ